MNECSDHYQKEIDDIEPVNHNEPPDAMTSEDED
jgi:hypothetical protein